MRDILRETAILVCACLVPATAAGAQPAGPLQLRDAIAEALRHSPELGAPSDAVASAELQRRQAAAPFGVRVIPNFSSGSNPGGYEMRTMGMTVGKRLPTGTDVWLSGSSMDFGSAGGRYRDRGYSAGFVQPLSGMLSHAPSAALESAKRGVTSAERRLTAARQQLIVSVAEAYYGVVQAERLADAGARARDRARLLVEASGARARAGLDTQLDVMRAQLLASQAEAAVGDRQEAVASARERLNLLLGRSAEAEIVVAEDPPPGLGAPVETVDAVASALALRVEALDGREHIADARRALALARWNLLPPVNLSVEYTRRGLGSALQPLFRPYNGWHVAVTSTYALDRGSQSASLGASDLALRAAERDARETEQRIAVEVRKATRAVSKADQAAAIQAQALEIARRQVDLARLRYERGLSDNLTVVDAESSLSQAESACIAAEIERRLARLRLERATGTLEVR